MSARTALTIPDEVLKGNGSSLRYLIIDGSPVGTSQVLAPESTIQNKKLTRVQKADSRHHDLSPIFGSCVDEMSPVVSMFAFQRSSGIS